MAMRQIVFTLLPAVFVAIGLANEGICPSTGCPSKDVAMLQMSRDSHRHVISDSSSRLVVHEARAERSHKPEDIGITVVSYNLYWWNVGSTNRWNSLYDRIKMQRPFDLIGFQECEDVASVVRASGLDGFEYYQGPNKPANNPAPLAWNAAVFSKISGPGEKWVASDQYGGRYLTWVRLRHIASGIKIFFANTHGPLGNCGSTVGNNWLSGVNDNKEPGDVVFVTGDYNCGTGSSAMNRLKDGLVNDNVNDIDGGIDQIITDFGRKESGGSHQGWPSDHPLIKGTFRVGGSGSGNSDSDDSESNGDIYKWVGAPRVGGWGGLCKCPSGRVYEVGDNYDSCGSVACVGGEVTKACGSGVISSSRAGWMVTCAESPGPTEAPTEIPTEVPTSPAPTPPPACRTAVSGDECYGHVVWAKDFGISLHPEWYPGLNEESTFEDFQRLLHQGGFGSRQDGAPNYKGCGLPCGSR